MKSKRIALVLPNLIGGGAERVALTLMRSFLEAGHEVDFVLMRAEGELLSEARAHARVVDLGAKRVRDAVVPLTRYFKETRPDAVQVSMWPLTIAAILAHRLARSRARLVTSDHAALSKQYAGQALAMASLRVSVRLFYPRADARVLVAQDAADDLARVSGLPRDSLEVIYNPVDDPPAGLGPSPDIENLWGAAAARVLTIGSLKAQKNHDLLIRSFVRLRRHRSDAKLMIVGQGSLAEALRRRAADLGIERDVVLAGFQSNPWPFYASADLFVLSSDYEGYPLVLLEAMKSGLPVVSTDCHSGPREILAGGEFGELVPVGDEAALAEAMERALAGQHDPDRIRKRAQSLSGPATAKRYLELLVGC